MTSTCQATVLNSPLLNWYLEEALIIFEDETIKPRNNRVRMNVDHLRNLDEVEPLPQTFSFFPQELQSYPFIEQTGYVDPLSTEEFNSLIIAASPICAAKLAGAAFTGISANQLLFRFQRVLSHQKIGLLRKIYGWKWFYEKLVYASARPKSAHVSEDRLKPVIKTSYSEGSVFYLSSGTGFEVWTTHSLTVIKDRGRSRSWVCTRNHLLMLADSINQRFVCLLTAILGDIFQDSSIPSVSEMLAMFEMGDKILDRFGNQGYSAIKCWEPLITAIILLYEEDPHVDAMEFYRNVRDDFLDCQGEENSEYMEDCFSLFQAIAMRAHRLQNIGYLTQTHGIYRIWGHPNVSGIDGAIKLKEIACQHRGINHLTIELMTCKWREFFTRGYHRSHGRLPSFVEESLTTATYVSSCLRRGELPDPAHPDYTTMSWASIQFDKTFLIPSRFDFTQMIADKATSLGLTDLKQECEKNGGIGSGASRSVIIRWIRTNYTTPREFLERISTHGFPADERVAGVFPKEREEKIDPRLFGLMPLVKRLYIVLTEALIADYILPIFPEITMTFDSTTLMNRLHSCTKKLGEQADDLGTLLITNIDFQKWNTYMREEETLGLFEDFDRLFGLENVFSRTHELFNPCTFYVADGSVTPQFDPVTNAMKITQGTWSGHLGGIEGLRQKGWTVFTVVLLKWVTEEMRVKSQIVGQGDNQVLINTYYPKPGTSIKDQHNLFMIRLNSLLSEIGPPLKLEESWSSSFFFTYGKFSIYKGVPQPSVLKRLSRIGRLNNDGIININGVLSSISANVSAAVYYGGSPQIPFFVGMMETLASLKLYLTEPLYGERLLVPHQKIIIRVPVEGHSVKSEYPMRDELSRLIQKNIWTYLKVLSVFPAALGGYPVTQISDLIIRGFPDEVTAAIWELKLIKNSDLLRELWPWVDRILSPIFNRYQNPELLCQAPTSLNLFRGSRMKDKLVRHVFNYLLEMRDKRNEAIIEFLRLAVHDQSELSQLLFSMEPCHPRVMADLYESTVLGQAMKSIKKIDKTPVLMDMMMKSPDHRRRDVLAEWDDQDPLEADHHLPPKSDTLISAFNAYERNELAAVNLTLNQKLATWNDDNRCSVQVATEWRRRSWGKDLEGVSVAFPRELLKLTGEAPDDISGYIVVTTVPHQHPKDLMTTLGPYSPYFGSTSKEKVEYGGKELKSVAPSYLASAISNFRLINWGTDPASSLSKLIKYIFHQFTDYPHENLIPKMGAISGTLAHRFADSRTSHSGTLSVPYVVGTHSSVSTNKFSPQNLPHAQGYDNFNIIFQGVFSYIAGDHVFRVSSDSDIAEREFLSISCAECVVGVNEESLNIRPMTRDDFDEMECLTARSDFMYIPTADLQMELEAKRPHQGTEQRRNERQEEVRSTSEFPLTPISPEGAVTPLSTLLILIILDDLLKGAETTDGLNEGRDELRHVIPVGFIPKLNTSLFFRYLGGFLISKEIFRQAWRMAEHQMPLEDLLFRVGVDLAISVTPAWCETLITLFLSNDIYHFIMQEHPNVEPPKGTPPSIREKAITIRQLILATSLKLCSTRPYRDFLEHIIKINLPVSSNSFFHPQILQLITWGCTADKEVSTQMWKLLAALRVKEPKYLGYSNLIDLRSRKDTVLDSDDEEEEDDSDDDGFSIPDPNDWAEERPILVTKVVIHGPLRMQESKNIPALESYPGRVMLNAGWIAKALGERSHPDQYIPKTIHTDRIYNKDLRRLPSGGTLHIAAFSMNGEETDLILPDVRLEFERSFINSLFKSQVLVTSAPYKLLTVLRELELKFALPSNPKVIFSGGDGTGGFSVLWGRLFPSASIIYNSLYQISALSSIGVDRFVPAAFALNQIDTTRILGLTEMEEGLSDLTDPRIVPQYKRLAPEIDIISCDAEGRGKDNPAQQISIFNNLLELADCSNTSLFIYKTYASRLDLLCALSVSLSSRYSNVQLIRSTFSGVGNTEIYLCGWGRASNSSKVEANHLRGEIYIKGRLPSVEELRSFYKRIGSLTFDGIADTISNSYTKLLCGERTQQLDPELYLLIREALSLTGTIQISHSILPMIRRMFRPVKFCARDGIRKNELVLTPFNIRTILKFYLPFYFCTAEVSSFRRFPAILQNTSVIFYETISNEWSIAIRESSKMGRNFRSVDTKEVFEDEVFSKLILNRVATVKKYCAFHHIPVISPCCPKTLITRFPTDSHEWYKSAGRDSISLADMPVQLEGQAIFPPRSLTKAVLRQMTEKDVCHLALDPGLLLLSSEYFEDDKVREDIQYKAEMVQRSRKLLKRFPASGPTFRKKL